LIVSFFFLQGTQTIFLTLFKDGRAFTDREVAGRYKFYLSIENNNCDDYVTEKIHRPYAVGVVPILDGPKDYSRFLATNHSSIRLDDFATSKQLAHRIRELDQDDAAYMKYLEYKESTASIESLLSPKLLETFDVPEGTWGPDGGGARCGICKLAHEMAEGSYQFNPNKVVGVDKTCDLRKWANISQEAALIRKEAQLYWLTVALVVLGIFALVTITIVCCKSHRVRRSLQAFRFNLISSIWREEKLTGDNECMEDYQLLASLDDH
jgi:alpha-1,3-fucosyltransferase 10